MVEIRKLDSIEIHSIDYLKLLEKYYNSNFERKLKQFEWYCNYKDYVTVVAIVEGVFVGQASAYACDVINNGIHQTIYWGCDTFILPNYRGLGIGKKLQQYLYDNVPNFTSIGYSKLNGIIKKKCGANVLGETTFVYYGVCTLVQFIFKKIAKKIFKINLNAKTLKYPVYLYFNRILCKNIKLCEQQYLDIESEVIQFIGSCLENQYDFYVVRDGAYVRWKYLDNKTMTFKMLTSRDTNGKLECVVFVTEAIKSELSDIELKYVKVLDVFIDKKKDISYKDIHRSIVEYFCANGELVDGLASMFNFNWLGKISFKREILSSLQNPINKPYFSYSDQDLEQML